MANRRVCIISFKGGAGNTTLAFYLGTGLTRFHGKRVLLIDVDFQSRLSLTSLGDRLESAVKERRIIDEVFRSYFNGNGELPNAGIISRRSYGEPDLVAADLLDEVETDLAAPHRGNTIHSEWNKRSLICRWIHENHVDEMYDYIIFDCPPATKIVTQNAIAACHSYVVPVFPAALVAPETPHLFETMRTRIDRRLQQYADSTGDTNPVFVRNTKLAGVVVTRTRAAASTAESTRDQSEQVRALERRWKTKIVDSYLLDGLGVFDALLQGFSAFGRGLAPKVGRRSLDSILGELTVTLMRRIDAVRVSKR